MSTKIRATDDDHAPFENYCICRSGRHTWTAADDAVKCCDPAWRRELRVGGDDVTTPLWKAHVWVRVPSCEGQ